MKDWKEIHQNVDSDCLWIRDETGIMNMVFPFAFLMLSNFKHHFYNQKIIF